MPADIFVLFPLLAVLVLNLPFAFLGCEVATLVTAMFAGLQVFITLFPCCSVFPSLTLFALSAGQHNYLFLAMIAVVVLAALSVAQTTIKDKESRFNFMNLLLIIMAGMNGLVMVSDLFTMYLFLEVTAISSWVFIAFERKLIGLEGALKYLILSAVATLFLLSGIAIIMLMVGSTELGIIKEFSMMNAHHPLLLLAFALLVIGLCIKGGVVPFHNWTPDAYSSAPTAVSILLAGITTKITGIYTIMRLYHEVFPRSGALDQLLMILGALSILVGALAAIKQQNVKRLLAYSSISQVGYIILAVGCGSELGYIAATFHFVNHAISKAQLFVNVAAVEDQIGSVEMERWIGIAEKMPVTGWSSVFGLLTTAGVPPFLGFWTKLLIVIAVWNSGHEYFASFAVLLSLVTLAYFLRLQRQVFYGKWNSDFSASITEAPLTLVVPAVLLILLGFWMIVPLLQSTLLVGGI